MSEETSHKPNRLAQSTSPYLLQHAYNPVDWHPWGEEALEKARREDKPIFLSIGYSSCHWCHVMERESFEDEEVARLLNERFVPIKVDREERPDLDEVYMTSVQVMTGQGGWPLSVFLTPELKPFYGGTYFPPEDRWGRPGFKTVLARLDELYQQRRQDLLKSADQVTEQLERLAQSEDAAAPQPAWVEAALRQLRGRFDDADGGFGEAPKFPPSFALLLLLRVHRRTRDRTLLHMVEVTLDHMAAGGIYDHLGGGFARYSTDRHWRVPHFEKMLYDNALLCAAYLEGWQVTGRPLYREVVRGICAFVLQEMAAPEGGFRSALDADSEGVEGRFYAWTLDEIVRCLGAEEGRECAALFGVTESGNWEHGLNVLHLDPEDAHLMVEPGQEERRARLGRWRETLLQARARRVPPGRDDKVIASWNGLMISALSRAGAALGEERLIASASTAAEFQLARLRPAGTLLHSFHLGRGALPAFLDDCSDLAQGTLDLFEATGEARWLEAAISLVDEMDARFWEESSGRYQFSEPAHATPLVRLRGGDDGAQPGGNSVAAHVLLRLARLTGHKGREERARRVLSAHAEPVARTPAAFHYLLCAVESHLAPPREIVVTGPARDAKTRSLRSAASRAFEPHAARVFFDPGARDAAALRRLLPLLEGKGDAIAAYLCSNGACQQPVSEPRALEAQLASG